MTCEVELEIGIPDYYREDLHSYEWEKVLDNAIKRSQELGVSLDFYLLEFSQ